MRKERKGRREGGLQGEREEGRKVERREGGRKEEREGGRENYPHGLIPAIPQYFFCKWPVRRENKITYNN